MASPVEYLAFFVDGEPQQQGSMRSRPIYANSGCPRCRFTGKVAMPSDNPRLKAWRKRVAAVAAAGMDGPLWTGPVLLTVRFYMGRPKAHLGTGKNAGKLRPSAPRYWEHTKKPDVDKLLRAIGDALTGVVFVDDAQLTDDLGRKVYADPGQPLGARITLRRGRTEHVT